MYSETLLDFCRLPYLAVHMITFVSISFKFLFRISISNLDVLRLLFLKCYFMFL